MLSRPSIGGLGVDDSCSKLQHIALDVYACSLALGLDFFCFFNGGSSLADGDATGMIGGRDEVCHDDEAFAFALETYS